MPRVLSLVPLKAKPGAKAVVLFYQGVQRGEAEVRKTGML